MSRISLITLFVLVLAGPAPWPASAEAPSVEAVERPDRTAVDRLPAGAAEDLQRFLDEAVAEGRISAAVAMVARDDELLWLGTAGEMAAGIPMRQDAILPLASVGKMFTATAAMILVEGGFVSLDDPVSRFIPEFDDVVVEVSSAGGETRHVAPARPITVRHLLTHTAGLTVSGDAFWEAWDAHTETTTTTHFARALAAMPLRSHPGERFEYGPTGASYEVLGAVIEIASGRTLEAFLEELVFDPLGLDDTHFFLPPEKTDRRPAIYRRADGVLRLDRPYGEDSSRSTFFHGGGGVRSSARDVLHFARLFLGGGAVDGVRILERQTVAEMMRDQLGERAPERWRAAGVSWGYGAAVEHSRADDGSPALEKYGWVGGGFARLWVQPDEKLVGYLNVPLSPPGDGDLLTAFEERVDVALGDGEP